MSIERVLQKLDAEVEGLHRRNRSTSGYIDPERGERMQALMVALRLALGSGALPTRESVAPEELEPVLSAHIAMLPLAAQHEAACALLERFEIRRRG